MGVDQQMFGSLLRRYRVTAGLTQERLAERAGLSLRGVSDLERGLRRLPYPNTIDRLIEALGLGPREQDALYAARRPMVPRAQLDPAPLPPGSILPVQLTSFIGREAELSDVERLLSTHRLVTLTGAGGVGKTRLALEVARQQAATFEQGVQFVPLAGVGAPSLLASAIAAPLGVSFQGPTEPHVQLIQYLRDKHVLLVLDSFEHLLDGADLLTDILSGAHSVKILVTSRVRLNLHEEWVLLLNGLRFPGRQPTERVDQYPAVKLFVERARQVQTDFSLPDNVQPIIDVCRHVEGLPLALELAATWLRVMPCDQIAPEIDRSVDFLTTSMRNLPDRHRSLRAVFDRSWTLVSEADQRILAQLSVFRGGFDREAAGYVSGASLAVLAGLADTSLIRPTLAGRFDMHELLRQYLAQKLAESGETGVVRHRHFDCFATLADRAEAEQYGPDQEKWFDRLEFDYDNLAAALACSLSEEHAEAGLRLAGALAFFCEQRGHFHDAHSWIEKLLALDCAAPASVRAKALWTAGMLAHYVGDDKKATARFEESVAIARAVGDRLNIAWCLANLGYIHTISLSRRARFLEEALLLFRAIGDGWGISHALRRLGWNLTLRGDYERAATLLEEALTLARQAQNKYATAWTLFLLGNVVWLQTRDPERATALYQESSVLARETRDRGNLEMVLLMLGQVAQVEEEYEQAKARYAEVVALEDAHRGIENAPGVGHLLVVALAQLAVATGKPGRAARLFGAVQMVTSSGLLAVGYRKPGGFEAELAALPAELGESAFARAFAEGRAMTIQQAIVYGLHDQVLRPALRHRRPKRGSQSAGDG